MPNRGDDRYAIIMAGGEGERLRPFVQELRQAAIPKQYVNFIGRRSMLEHTIDRAQKMFSPDHIFAVVSQSHLEMTEARRQLAMLPGENILAQPLNRGTWPGLLLPLARIFAKCADATVVVFPADHFIGDEELFLRHVAFALFHVEEQPARMALLGVTPDSPDSELGYIVPVGRPGDVSAGLLPVKEFMEKPSLEQAKTLLSKGALWNTLILIAKAKTLVHYTREIAPELYQTFLHMMKAIGSPVPQNALKQLYENIAAVDLSHGLLATLPQRKPRSLITLPIKGVLWSDWGSKRRILSMLDKTGYRSRLSLSTAEPAVAPWLPEPSPTMGDQTGERLPISGRTS